MIQYIEYDGEIYTANDIGKIGECVVRDNNCRYCNGFTIDEIYQEVRYSCEDYYGDDEVIVLSFDELKNYLP